MNEPSPIDPRCVPCMALLFGACIAFLCLSTIVYLTGYFSDRRPEYSQTYFAVENFFREIYLLRKEIDRSR